MPFYFRASTRQSSHEASSWLCRTCCSCSPCNKQAGLTSEGLDEMARAARESRGASGGALRLLPSRANRGQASDAGHGPFSKVEVSMYETKSLASSANLKVYDDRRRKERERGTPIVLERPSPTAVSRERSQSKQHSKPRLVSRVSRDRPSLNSIHALNCCIANSKPKLFASLVPTGPNDCRVVLPVS